MMPENKSIVAGGPSPYDLQRRTTPDRRQTMTTSLTFKALGAGHPHHARAGRRRAFRWPIVLAAALASVAVPVSACEKSATIVASTSSETRVVATFTGEFADGVPVYRLPAINVVGRPSGGRRDDAARRRIAPRFSKRVRARKQRLPQPIRRGRESVAEVGGAAWEGSDTRFGKTMWQGVDSEIFRRTRDTAGKYVFTRVRPNTQTNPCRLVPGRLQP
jgi:hypothetical protein